MEKKGEEYATQFQLHMNQIQNKTTDIGLV